jgi:hypothetical protein
MLSALGIVKSAASQTATVFEKIEPNFLRLAARTPGEYMMICWSAYRRGFPDQGVSTNGKFFELCIATALIREAPVGLSQFVEAPPEGRFNPCGPTTVDEATTSIIAACPKGGLHAGTTKKVP